MELRWLPGRLQRRFDPQERYGLRVTLFAIAMLLVAVPFLVLLVQVTADGPVTEVDAEVAADIYEDVHRSQVLIAVSHVLSFIGGPLWWYPVIALTASFFWRRGDPRVAVYLVVTNLVGGIVNRVVKLLVSRPRPEFEDPIADAYGQSFPSGHAMASAIGYGTLMLVLMPLVPRRWRVPFVGLYVLLVVLVSLSRLALGVHYLSDVIAGAVLGVAWLAAATAAFSIWRQETDGDDVDVLEGADPEIAERRS